MKKSFMHFVSLFPLILSVCCSVLCASEVTFFDVGQGNCTLVTFKGGKPNKMLPPLLVDGGSSSFKESLFQQLKSSAYSKNRRNTVIDEVAAKIIYVLNVTSPKLLNVVVSHGDSDHYNLISDIVKQVKGAKTLKSLIVNYYLGGATDDYTKGFTGKFVNLGDVIYDYSPNYQCIILASLRSLKASKSESVDTNANSVVLHVKNLKLPIRSVILTGDATEKTTGEILKAFSSPGILKTTILQASHHGADSHGSNKVDWFQSTSPEFVVISTGTNDSYNHPRQKMIKNAMKSPTLKRNVYRHFLQYDSDWPFIDTTRGLDNHYTVSQASSGYFYGLTELGIFSTVSQGNILFDLTATNLNPSFSKPKPMSAFSDVYKAIEWFLKNTSREETTSITFPPIDFSSGGLNYNEFENLIKLIAEGKGSSLPKIKGLISCDLSKVKLAPADVTKFVTTGTLFNDFIGLTSLQQLDLPESFLVQKINIVAAWNKLSPRKGLRFIIID